MRRWVALLGLAVLAVGPAGHAGPVDGPRGFYEQVPAGSILGGERSPGVYSVVKTFRGGERAAVHAIGDHQPVVDLTVNVYDKDNRLVATDTGRGAVGDLVAVVWYPPRTAPYRIEVLSPGPIANKCFIVIK